MDWIRSGGKVLHGKKPTLGLSPCFPPPPSAPPSHAICPGAYILALGVRYVEKIRLKLQQQRFVAPHTSHHRFKLSCTSAILPLTQASHLAVDTGLGVLGKAPMATVGCPKMEPCVQDFSIPLTAGSVQRSTLGSPRARQLGGKL